MAELVAEARAAEPEPEAFAVHRPAGEGFRVERVNDDFVVVGRQAERAVAVNDLTNRDALAYVHGRLRRLGVDRALARAGARDGDTVHVGPMTFEDEEEVPAPSSTIAVRSTVHRARA
jgi:GTP-binding protein